MVLLITLNECVTSKVHQDPKHHNRSTVVSLGKYIVPDYKLSADQLEFGPLDRIYQWGAGSYTEGDSPQKSEDTVNAQTPRNGYISTAKHQR